MEGIAFTWDSRKEVANQRKHGVSFEVAKTAFLDENARLMEDPDHSEEEDRFILLGLSAQLRLLVVCHCYREDDDQLERRTALSGGSTRASDMRDSYDFSKSRKNPYARRLKKPVTIRLDEETIAYFKDMAEKKGIPYQSLINLYLRDCAERNRDLKVKWS